MITAQSPRVDPAAEVGFAHAFHQDALSEKVARKLRACASSAFITLSQHPHLSGREREVISLMGQGYSNADIARDLSISVYTVANHVRRIMEKTGTHNRTAAVHAERTTHMI